MRRCRVRKAEKGIEEGQVDSGLCCRCVFECVILSKVEPSEESEDESRICSLPGRYDVTSSLPRLRLFAVHPPLPSTLNRDQ